MNDMLVLKWKKDKAPLPQMELALRSQGVYQDVKGDYQEQRSQAYGVNCFHFKYEGD